ncbi:hypothetical protein BDN67DRAFT_916742 [Paxillus ammoniavirescens]|nr:hypothetical protein BDN67DRAFT_916742 [Paxillus ammoniavirescens]
MLEDKLVIVEADGEEHEAQVEDAELAELVLEDEDGAEDTNGQAAHDVQVTKSLRNTAIREMAQQGIVIDEAENKAALGIFPKVAGLAKKVHDSTTIGEQFAKLCITNQEVLSGNKEALDRRVPTRWNSDLACLDAHIYFRPVIQQLTASADLKSFRLTEAQWPLAVVLADVLSLLSDPTKIFSTAGTPLVPAAVPMLTQLEGAFRNVSNDANVPSVVRVAAHAGVLLSEKYYNLLEECEVYRLSIVMSPDKKLAWFTSNGYTAETVASIRTLAIKRWQDSYCKPASTTPRTAAAVASTSGPAPVSFNLSLGSSMYLIYCTACISLATSNVGCCSAAGHY